MKTLPVPYKFIAPVREFKEVTFELLIIWIKFWIPETSPVVICLPIHKPLPLFQAIKSLLLGIAEVVYG